MKIAEHNGQRCFFNENPHKYWVGDTVLTSVTKFIRGFFPEFKADEIAEKYAQKHGLLVKDVLSDWKRKGDEGRDLGKLVHYYIESCFVEDNLGRRKEPPFIPEKYKDHIRVADEAIRLIFNKFKFIAAEQIVFSVELGLAGQIDLLMRDDRYGLDILVMDWKTNAKISKDNPWQEAMEPIQHLDACNWNEYCIQLNIYEYIMKKEKYFPGCNFRKGLIHIGGDPVKLHWHKVPDMQDMVEKMVGWI